MSDKEKIVAAQAHVESLVTLLQDNPWKPYLYQHLSTIKWELHRQLTNLQITDNIEE